MPGKLLWMIQFLCTCHIQYNGKLQPYPDPECHNINHFIQLKKKIVTLNKQLSAGLTIFPMLSCIMIVFHQNLIYASIFATI